MTLGPAKLTLLASAGVALVGGAATVAASAASDLHEARAAEAAELMRMPVDLGRRGVTAGRFVIDETRPRRAPGDRSGWHVSFDLPFDPDDPTWQAAVMGAVEVEVSDARGNPWVIGLLREEYNPHSSRRGGHALPNNFDAGEYELSARVRWVVPGAKPAELYVYDRLPDEAFHRPLTQQLAGGIVALIGAGMIVTAAFGSLDVRRSLKARSRPG